MTEYQELTEKGSDDSSDNRQWFVAKGLLHTSMDLLERRQRTVISNCTLQKLLERDSTMSKQQLADYVSLLGLTVEKPSKSLEVVSEAKSDGGTMLTMAVHRALNTMEPCRSVRRNRERAQYLSHDVIEKTDRRRLEVCKEMPSR